MDTVQALVVEQPILSGLILVGMVFVAFKLFSGDGGMAAAERKAAAVAASFEPEKPRSMQKKKKKGKGKKNKAASRSIPDRTPEPEPESELAPEAEMMEVNTSGSPEKSVDDVGTAPPAKKKKKKRKKKSGGQQTVQGIDTELSKDDDKENEGDEEDEDEEDDAVEAARILSQKQLAAAEGKKKKKKKKKKKIEIEETAEEDGENWEKVQGGGGASGRNGDSSSAPVSEATESDKPKEITLTLGPEDNPAAIIGPKGATIQEIEVLSGAKIDIVKNFTGTGSSVRISAGSDTSLSLALDSIQQILANERERRAKIVTFTLSSSEINGSDGVKAIIGKAGSTIQGIQAQTGVIIEASVDNGTVTITGHDGQPAVDEAVRLCKNAVFGEKQDVIELGSQAMVRCVCGRDFAKIQSMQEESGARLDIARGSSEMKLSGSKEAVTLARDLVQRWMEHCRGVTLHIEGNKVGAIYGKSGATIRSIQERTGAFIDVERNGSKAECSIVGEPDAVEEARVLVQKSIDGEIELKPGEVKEAVELGAGTPAVIGRGGSKVAELERTYGVRINVSSDSGVCSIVGKKEAVETAKEAVETIVAPIIAAEKAREEADRLAAQGDSAWQDHGNGFGSLVEDAAGW